MPNIYIRKKRTINNEGLAERLPSGVHQVHVENKVRRVELPVPVHKDFGP